ncbi:MAG: Ig-like domain-containing protein [Candidatus Cloacimonetes bacterium]|nr:Ig-like domain-containing protein [Candidatus Cloacimonadota bacterium]
MKFPIKLIFAILIFSGLISCGHKKNPTGGKKDTIQPEIVSVIPDEYSDITDSDIEIIFSKPIERNTILSGIYIYPPIIKKKFSWDGNILTIKILEELEKHTNYYFNFSEKIKGEHGNFLNTSSSYIFASGKLNSNRISGNFLFEEAEDNHKPIQMTILTADSTEVFSQEAFGKTYKIEDLNDVGHIIRAYIDKNENFKYDNESEPYFQKSIDPVNSATMDIYLAYADTIKPQLKSTSVIFNNSINVTFSEPINSFSQVSIRTADSLETKVFIKAYYLINDELTLLTSDLDTLVYKINFINIEDLKKNMTSEGSLLFDGTTLQDTIPPEVISSNPRTGSSVNSFLPKISVIFSEIIMEDCIETKLSEVETGKVEDLKVISKNSKHYIFSSLHRLNNYSSYKFTIQAKDNSENIMTKPLEIIFLPIVRKVNKD